MQIAIGLALASALIAPSAAKDMDAAIKRVVVYEDRAMVTRTGTVQVDAGSSQVIVPGLPPLLMDDSVRVKGEAQGKVLIVGTEVKKAFLADPRQKEVEELEKKLDSLRLEDQGLSDRLEALALQKKFVASIQSSMSEKISKEMLLAPPAPEGWVKVADFIYQASLKAADEERKIGVEKKELAKKIEVAEKELNQVKSCAARDAKSVVVSVEAEKPSALNLEVSYVIPAATWRPVYDARADHAGGKIDLTYRSEIRQKTGEDWKGVELALSTARPSVGGRMAELSPWYINIWEPPLPEGGDHYKMAAAESAPEAMRPSAGLYSVRNLQEESVPIQTFQATAQKAGAAVTFAIARPQDIPSDNQFHGAAIAEKKVDAEFEYVSTPKLSEFAYLLARFKNAESYPLLAGKINLFLGQDFVGTSDLETVAPGEKAELYLGIDEEVKVKRELVSESTEKGGFFKGRPGQKMYQYRITVESFRKTKDKMTVFDQLPVSQSPDIKVELEKSQPEPAEPVKVEDKEKPGLLVWKFDLTPGAKKTIVFSFLVEYPKDKEVNGL
ncbi:MAG: mucoidy inhibitor MuiA family protein [Candidatus Aureabacteria bacterium]|nr:mucoidy inhibitor MuiA family protein [Candidatus Auribacterota bacterium]